MEKEWSNRIAISRRDRKKRDDSLFRLKGCGSILSICSSRCNHRVYCGRQLPLLMPSELLSSTSSAPLQSGQWSSAVSFPTLCSGRVCPSRGLMMR